MHPGVFSPVLILNSLNSIPALSYDPCQFAYIAKNSILDTVACQVHSIHPHIERWCKALKDMFLNFSIAMSKITVQVCYDKFSFLFNESGSYLLY